MRFTNIGAVQVAARVALRTQRSNQNHSDKNGFKTRRSFVAVSEVALEGGIKRSLAYAAAAILIAGVLISATLILVPLSRPPTTVTETSVSTITTTQTSVSTERCTPLQGAPPLGAVPPVIASVYVDVPNNGASELFNATVTGYSGSKEVFSQCYVGVDFSDVIPWNAPNIQNWTSVKITAQKMQADNYNLTLSSHGVINSTIAPFGFVSVYTVPNLSG
jgi:hypothetical protein